MGSKSASASAMCTSGSGSTPAVTLARPAVILSDQAPAAPSSNTTAPGDEKPASEGSSRASWAGTYSPKNRAIVRGASLIAELGQCGSPHSPALHQLADDVGLESSQEPELHAKPARLGPAHDRRQANVFLRPGQP